MSRPRAVPAGPGGVVVGSLFGVITAILTSGGAVVLIIAPFLSGCCCSAKSASSPLPTHAIVQALAEGSSLALYTSILIDIR